MKKYLKVMKNQLGTNKVMFKPVINMEKFLSDTRFNFIIDEGIAIPIKNIGQGYISKFIIALALGWGKAKILGIEEPELHMHPTAIRDLLTEIQNKAGEKQIIFTSHSPIITNYVNPDSIVVVKKEQRYSRTYCLAKMFENQFDDYKDISRQIFLNRQKTELLFSKGVIYVEGQYDRLVEIDRA
jgi:predicted ATP-dependent endonuclease of OLD family